MLKNQERRLVSKLYSSNYIHLFKMLTTIFYTPNQKPREQMQRTNAKSRAVTGEPGRAGSNDPLTPLALFQRGIAMTREIRGRIEESRAYYLGRSSRAPGQTLSEVFDPTRGPILKYFIETIRTINKTCNQRTDGSTVTKPPRQTPTTTTPPLGSVPRPPLERKKLRNSCV